MVSFKNYLYQLRFFAKGYELYLFFLFIIAVTIGLIDAASVALLYPMLSVGFQIKADNIPFIGVIEQISSIIPIGSPFVHLGLLFIACTGGSLCLQLIYWKVALIFQRRVIISTKNAIFAKINHNDYQFFVDTRQGDLINLFNQSPYYLQQTYDKGITIATEMVTSCFVIAMLFFISPGGLVLMMVGGGIFYLILHIIGNNISEKLGNLQISSGQSENKVINEYITGIKPIKALHASDYWEGQYNSALKIFWDRFSEYMFIQKVPILAINSLFYICIGVIVLILYIYYADTFLTTIPVLGTFAAGMMKILPKFMNIGGCKLELKNYLPHVSTIYSVMHEKRYQKVTNGTKDCSKIETDIILDNICFSYGSNNILNNVSLIIKKGAMTALVGPSGSGKSTIASLLLRLYDPDSGSIHINGVDLKMLDINSYREIVGYVSQDSFVFNATIRENILFGRKFTDFELKEAAKLAHAHEFIMNLPDGYDTIVGDMGVTLSGGEKQRIVIARAMIRRPQLLVLDEATSALDNISEVAVQTAIDLVAKECTSLVIAHRLSTIENSDSIIVLEKGRVMEKGKYLELMKMKGKFWEMKNRGG